MKNVFFIMLGVALFGCGNITPTPKPVGYFRIDIPEYGFSETRPETCPFSFPLSEMARVEFSSRENLNKCWFNLSYPGFDARVHFTYREVDENLRELIEESRLLTYEHQVKATRINEQAFSDVEDSVYGLMYTLGGDVASPLQFYLTDSTNHFLRGALYFNARPNPDSIAPVLIQIENDLHRFTEDFKWLD